ncbi:Dynein heavy chain 11; axonemal [Camelus dromedarius]|uniref:Dynein heavy chain 11 n=1 Tax=Camelus dromedarius TaxID=9838 RepID=A0A5N4E060_CAMDR|nr:Dynein heavy chain 11; axonemal [Camelus dromedarius]
MSIAPESRGAAEGASERLTQAEGPPHLVRGPEPEGRSPQRSLRPQRAEAGTPFPGKRDAPLNPRQRPRQLSSHGARRTDSGSQVVTGGRRATALTVIAGGGGLLPPACVRRAASPARGWAGERASSRPEPASPPTCPMAAPVTAREAPGLREAPNLRLTPEAGLEAAGMVELEGEDEEEEEEEEAVAAARRARTFAQDTRVRFVGGRVEQMLGLREEKWSQYLESEGGRQVLREFLESPSPACLVFSVAGAGRLAASQQIPRDAKHKIVYIAKKITESIGVNEFPQTVLFGELPASSLGHVAAFLDEILVPILSNKNNHKSWSYFISQDMERHIEVMRSKMHVFRGKMLRRTLLPIPTIAGNIDLDQKYSETKVESNERTILHAIESVVIKWSHQIQKIVEQDSVQPLLNCLRSDPQTELDFWTMRRENLSCIYDQLRAPIVLKMVKILKNKQSSYFPTVKDIFMAVKHALLEARDVELHLRPLRRHIQCLQETEFPQIRVLIAPLFHTICLIWSHSKFYNTPARVIVLLQEFCNLFIDQAIAYLSPEELLKGEIEDSLEKVQVAVNILKTFRNSFFNYRKGLASYFVGSKELKPWDFQSHLVFCRFDKFLDRVMKIEDIFVTMLEFEKLDRLEFGGTKGAILNGQIHEMSEEFMELCKLFKQSAYDACDDNNMVILYVCIFIS